jgi:hypothetical protein
MLIGFTLLIAAVLSYYMTPWVAVPVAVLLYVAARALQFLGALYTNQDVGPYAYLRELNAEREAYKRLGAIPPLPVMMAPRASYFFAGVACVLAAFMWRWFQLPARVGIDAAFFSLAGLGAFSMWTQAPSVGMSRVLGFSVAAVCLAIPTLALVLGISPFQ